MRISSGPSAAGSGRWLTWALVGAGAGFALASVTATVSALAAHFARQVVTPLREREENLDILAVTGSPDHRQVILPANDDTTVDGTYSLVYDGGRGHARVGPIRSYAPREGTVLRDLEAVYSGDPARATRGWWSGAVYPSPSAAGFAEEEISIPVEGGHAPAWLIRAGTATDRWAIMVHGRGAQRTEGLRAVETARSLGMSSLLVSYRNDGEAPSAPDGRYSLGMTEWRDIEAAIGYAVGQGARHIVLFGWSMGGAICLQTADLSTHRGLVRAMVLDGPVVNWVEVLAYHAQTNRIPAFAGRLAQWLLSSPVGRRVTGLASPLDLKSMDWVARAGQLTVPTLIIHSEDDEFVPVGASADLAESNPELVTLARFHRARHTKEWNVDPSGWHRTVTEWLAAVPGSAPLPGPSV
jgi:pimeloyl-ACP methyl ester carboxylesterase